MKTFNLPDLGEGLADAEIREWHVKVGDEVKVDQPLVCMETAKAVVEVPSPQAGRISQLHGNPGDVIATGAPLVEFDNAEGTAPAKEKDRGSVVGSLEESTQRLDESDVIIGNTKQQTAGVKAMPAVRALAKQMHVDLNAVKPSGPQGQITAEDVKNAANQKGGTIGVAETLHGVRRAMANVMTQSHQEIVPVTLIDDADITDFPKGTDITARLIQAMIAGIKAEPALNAWYDGKALERRLFAEINIGLAIDSEEGLFVPVLKDVAKSDPKVWREQIETFKKSVASRTVSPSELHGATITLTNFGMIAGRYATPIVVPPMVSILGCGKIREAAIVYNGKIEARRIAPLSLTFDHRSVTGGEASRFLAAVIKALEGPSA
ncbi:MAG: dihydrolipoamide acetyltransferase family protein [Gammaproteobacteria bacterium]|nr:dihydrolipoamide acetyltransferase family protein [Gammaproteobacteria bacterium]